MSKKVKNKLVNELEDENYNTIDDERENHIDLLEHVVCIFIMALLVLIHLLVIR